MNLISYIETSQKIDNLLKSGVMPKSNRMADIIKYIRVGSNFILNGYYCEATRVTDLVVDFTNKDTGKLTTGYDIGKLALNISGIF